MSTYLFLLHEPATSFEAISPDEVQAIIERYRSWSEGLAARGKLLGGDKLVDGEGRVVASGDSEVMVTDGPYAEAKEVIGGVFRIEADDYDEAVDLARSCPHLDFGKIEIREIEPT